MRGIASYIVIASLTVAAAAAGPMTGWISDASCGAANASADKSARECAERCIKSGAPAVFVSDADQKVYKIAGAVKVSGHLQHKVQITGDVKGDTITIKEIRKAD
jgi:hypothetical protein